MLKINRKTPPTREEVIEFIRALPDDMVCTHRRIEFDMACVSIDTIDSPTTKTRHQAHLVEIKFERDYLHQAPKNQGAVSTAKTEGQRLIDRLRDYSTSDDDNFRIEHWICEEAADEIARLQHQLTALGKAADNAAMVLATIEAESTDEEERIQAIIDQIAALAPAAILGTDNERG